MKIIKTMSKNNSSWSSKMVETSIPKYAKLTVDAGEVSCPISDKKISTINCEICEHCGGIDFDINTNSEAIKCAHKESSNVKMASTDEVDRLYVSEKVTKENKDINPEDLKSFFARSELKYRDLDEKDDMNGHKIVSAKNISENESDGTKNFVPKYSNSIFDSDAISKLSEAQKNSDEEKEKSKENYKSQKKESKKEWEKDMKEALKATGYEPKGMTRSTSSETASNNPNVSEYKFSIFDNVDERIKNIPELTNGEKLKSQAQERKANISREKIKDDWETKSSKPTTTSGIVKDFFDKAFSKEQ